MDEKREIRSVECQLAIREAAQDAQSESRTITGTAIVFNRESQELDDWGERFKEIILPEACSMAFLNTQDVKLNLLHDRQLTIARCNKGDANASLRLSVDANGVNFEFDAPRCDLGDRALELVRTGVYSGCSFEFRPKDYEKKVEGDSVTIIHRSFERLGAITLGMDPAYTQTSVNVRELIKAQPQKTEEELQREREEQEQQQREQAEREAEQRALRAYERRQRALHIESFD
jgi:HK97 family phage prohead protease